MRSLLHLEKFEAADGGFGAVIGCLEGSNDSAGTGQIDWWTTHSGHGEGGIGLEEVAKLFTSGHCDNRCGEFSALVEDENAVADFDGRIGEIIEQGFLFAGVMGKSPDVEAFLPANTLSKDHRPGLSSRKT